MVDNVPMGLQKGGFMDDRVGQQLGNYRLLQLLGQGGFADVYLSEHIHLHTRAAIKVLQVRLVESNVQSFLNEARTIAHLVHPYIIRVLDFGVQDGIPFLVMDYAPKGTFRQRFLNRHGQPLPAASLFPYIRQVATALQYAHDKKLIHRDVKPENMLLGPNDEVLLSDFGFALIQSSTSRSSMETAGTAAYMAPEQLQGKPCPASDQYALGIIAYEWLTGSCPFQGTFFEIASQHMLTLPLPLRKKVPSLSAEVENVVMTALAKDPRQRFPTVQDFAVALENACSIGKVVSLIDQTRSDAITRLTDWSDNTRPVTDFTATQVQTKFPEPNSGIHDLSQSETHPFSQFGQSSLTQQNHALSSTRPLPPTSDALTTPISHDLSQSSQYPLTQQGHSRSGIRPLPPTPDALTTPISHDLSQSGQYPLTQQGHSRSGIRPLPPTPDALTTPPSHDLSQSSQYPLTQQSHSRSGIRPLSPEPSSLIRESSPSVPNSLSTVSPMSMSNSQSSLSQNNLEQSNQQWQQPSDFASDRTQLKPASRQQFSQRQQGTTFKDDLQRYRRSGTPASMIIFVIALAIFIIGGGAGLIYWSSNQPHMGKEKNSTGLFHGQINRTTSTFLTATATSYTTSTSLANINPYGIDQNTLVVNSLLDSNSLTAQWQENPQSNCQFTNGSYHALAMPNLLTTCFAIGTTSYTNFTYEVQMQFIKNGPKYTSGGILFRGSKDQQQFYLFEVYASGRYLFQKCNKNGSCTILAGSTTDPPSPAYHVGQTNTLAVVAKQNMFSFYINQHLIGSQQTDNNNPYTQGMIGVLARGGLQTNIPTEVAYNHVRVWR
jgi:serine/threonine protein kinase